MGQQERKIKGYKCPTDLWAGDVKKDTLYVQAVHFNYYPEGNDDKDFYIAKEIVETWEPVYEEEFKVGDHIIFYNLEKRYKEFNNDVVKITSIVPDQYHELWINHTPDSFSGGGFGYAPHRNNFRKATPEEIKKTTETTLYFGKVGFRIKKSEGIAITSHGKVTKEEIKKAIDYIENPPSLAGYGFRIHYKGTAYLLKDLNPISDINIGFGCQNGTLAELKAIYKAFEN